MRSSANTMNSVPFQQPQQQQRRGFQQQSPPHQSSQPPQHEYYDPYVQQPQQSGDFYGGAPGGGGGGWDNPGGGWDTGGQTSSGGYADSGHMSGHMGAPPSMSNPSAVDTSRSGIVRSISSTLLGEGEPDEPPILEELGINVEHIMMKTKIVLWPKRTNITSTSPIVQDDDFAGPLLFCLGLGTILLFKGKVHFGTIYAVFLTGWLGLWAVLNLMSQKGIGLTNTASVIGYSLLPIVFLAALSLAIELRGLAGALCIPLAVLWCAYAASLFFVAALDADDRRWLLAYPVALFYTCFALISIF